MVYHRHMALPAGPVEGGSALQHRRQRSEVKHTACTTASTRFRAYVWYAPNIQVVTALIKLHKYIETYTSTATSKAPPSIMDHSLCLWRPRPPPPPAAAVQPTRGPASWLCGGRCHPVSRAEAAYGAKMHAGSNTIQYYTLPFAASRMRNALSPPPPTFLRTPSISMSLHPIHSLRCIRQHRACMHTHFHKLNRDIRASR